MDTEAAAHERRGRRPAHRASGLVAATAGVATLLLPLISAAPGVAASAHDAALPGDGAVGAPAAAPRARAPHVVLARITPGLPAGYLPVDAPLRGVEPAQALEVRFQVTNPAAVAIAVTPRLEYRRSGAVRYTPVPERPRPGAAFHLAPEPGTARAPRGGSRSVGTRTIAPRDLRIRPAAGAAGLTPVAGVRLPGAGTHGRVPLPPRSVTEVEFSIRVTPDARYSATYELRLADGGAPLPEGSVARVAMGPEPPARLSPGQRGGVAVAAPARTGGHREAALRYPLRVPASTATAASPVRTAMAVAGPHGPFSSTTDECAVCHRSHTAQSGNLLRQAGPQSNLCLTCHDGTGAATNVKAQYTDAAVPADNPAAREYYRHDALVASSHTRSDLDEFGGVLNRHSECGDCHNPHRATGTSSTQTAGGWTAGGRLDGVSGVSVANGPAGSAPTYTFLDGVTRPVTLEYQLCLKCHSGFTILPSNSGFAPSRFVLDKGVEINPANGSYHPVAAAGTNTTQKMADDLAGTSPYKQWTLTVGSTIRCTSCHASGRRYDPVTPPAAGSDLPPHTSPNRSMLLLNYRDRILKSAGEGYAAADFALCYACHGELPFANATSAATNFGLHGLHLTGIAGKGSGGVDIDTPGAGQGNAICAECHFRLHSTAYPDGAQTISGERLLNFAPNVLPAGGVRSWTRTATGGSCTLTCHGQVHTGDGY